MSETWNEFEDYCSFLNPAQDAMRLSEKPEYSTWPQLMNVTAHLQDWPKDSVHDPGFSNAAQVVGIPQTAHCDESTALDGRTDSGAPYDSQLTPQMRPHYAILLESNEHMVSHIADSSQSKQNVYSPQSIDEYTQHKVYADSWPGDATIDPYEMSCMASDAGPHHLSEQNTSPDAQIYTSTTANHRVSIPRIATASQAGRRGDEATRFACNLCGKDFGRNADLVRHKNDIHGQAKVNYECTAIGCKFSHCRLDKAKMHSRQTDHDYQEIITV